MQKQDPVNYFKTGLRLTRYKPAEGTGTFCAVFIETDDNNGKALRIEPIRTGGVFAAG